MGVTFATLEGHRVTTARASIPAWGCWYADISIDGEHALTGAVTLKIADLTLNGTVLSGGPAKGRSHYRMVAGGGGWGRTVPRKHYENDAGTKVAKILSDAATEVREPLDTDTIASTARVGPSFVRAEGPASRLLAQLAPQAWYIGEDGITRLGRRASTMYDGKATHGPVDLARGTVTLAAESIAAIVPGIVVDGLTAVDVQHEISAEDGLRSTIWGATSAGNSRRLATLNALADQFDPHRKFRGVSEYRVVSVTGKRMNLQPVRVSTGMPDLARVLARGEAGVYADALPGARVLVGFADADPGRPFVAAFEDAEGGGFQPTSLSLMAGGMAGGEHLMTTEATALLIYNTLVALMTAAGGGPLLAAVLQPLIGTAINSAITAQAAPAPVGQVAQAAAATAQLAGFATGTVPSNTSAFFDSAIAAAAAKTPNVSGLFPSIGSKAVRTS